MQSADPADDLAVDIESGAVVLEVAPMRRLDGHGYEWTYRFRRIYEYGGREKPAFFFRHGEHDADVSRALVYAIQWMSEHDPDQWVREQLKEVAA